MTPLPSASDFPRGWRWLGAAVITYLTTRNRWRSTRSERKRRPVLDRTINTLREQQLKCQKYGLSDLQRVNNVSLYLLLVDRDFSFMKTEMVSTFDPQRLRFVARQQALLLWEAADDLTTLLGREFRQSLSTLRIGDAAIGEFNAIVKRLHAFKSTNHKFLYSEVRNVVAGHRAQDSLEFLNKVEAIDPLVVFELGAQFYDFVHAMSEFLVRVTIHAGKLPVMMRQMLASPKFLETLKLRRNQEAD
jgi:hypothetical protein